MRMMVRCLYRYCVTGVAVGLLISFRYDDRHGGLSVGTMKDMSITCPSFYPETPDPA